MTYEDCLKLTADKWNSLDVDTKVEILNTLEAHEAEVNSRIACPVEGRFLYTGNDGIVMGQGVFSGQTDEEGLADGTWKLTMKLSDGSTLVFYDKWEHGVIKECYYINNTTGDKEKINGGIPSVIYDVVRTPCQLERLIDRGSDEPWEGVLLDKKEVDNIRARVMDSDEVYQLPKPDYDGCANDEEFIQAKSTIPNILYKLNGTNVDCVIDEQGNVTDFEFKQTPKDPAVAKELERCLGMLKYKPAIYKLFTVKCKWNFWYDGNKSLLPEEPEEQISNVEAEKKVEDKVFDVVEQYPSFPGGEGAMFSYISNNLQYPEKAQENGIQGRVVVKFIVEKDGSISNVEVNRSVDPDLDNEAMRVIKNMPKWNPAKQNGTEVRAYYYVPVTFRLK